jgi:hypothetical protein
MIVAVKSKTTITNIMIVAVKSETTITNTMIVVVKSKTTITNKINIERMTVVKNKTTNAAK